MRVQAIFPENPWRNVIVYVIIAMIVRKRATP